jgi:hypothetical protein
VSGGLGVAKKLYVGDVLSVSIPATITAYGGTIYAPSLGNGTSCLFGLGVNGGTNNSGFLAFNNNSGNGSSNNSLSIGVSSHALAINGLGAINISTATDTTSTLTGALVIAGGVGIAKDLTIGGSIHQKCSTNSFHHFYNDNQTTVKWQIGMQSSTNNFLVYNASNVGVYIASGATSWTASSDERLKKNITEIDTTDALSMINQLHPVTYNYISDPEDTPDRFGLIAQQVKEVIPEIVNVDSNGMYGIEYTELIPILMAAIKKLDKKVLLLQDKIDALT